jgi:3-ketosteroid 9alpha-monooxygenase subunit A
MRPSPGRSDDVVGDQPVRYAHGWYQLAFERDLSEPVTPLRFAGRALMAVRSEGAGPFRLFDAVCPHRGAHLAYGGRLITDAILCPFHGHRVGLGAAGHDGFCVREYGCLVQGGGVFVRLSDQAEPDFAKGLQDLGAGHTFVPGFEMTAETTMEVVIENGFDSAHFRSVHGLMSIPGLVADTGPFGELVAEGCFDIPWGGGSGGASPLKVRYHGHAFSPGIFIAEMDGDPPFQYRIMTTATPGDRPGVCTIRLTLILPNAADGRPPAEPFASDLMDRSREGLELDRAIWNRLDPHHKASFVGADQAAIAFGDFCRRFRNDVG